MALYSPRSIAPPAAVDGRARLRRYSAEYRSSLFYYVLYYLLYICSSQSRCCEIREKRGVSDLVFLVDNVHGRRIALTDLTQFRCERHRNRNGIERATGRANRRITSLGNCFGPSNRNQSKRGSGRIVRHNTVTEQKRVLVSTTGG